VESVKSVVMNKQLLILDLILKMSCITIPVKAYQSNVCLKWHFTLYFQSMAM